MPSVGEIYITHDILVWRLHKECYKIAFKYHAIWLLCENNDSLNNKLTSSSVLYSVPSKPFPLAIIHPLYS